MDFLSGLALILLTLVGYSSGSVLGARRRAAVPRIPDLLVIMGAWMAALATRNVPGKWLAIGIWLVLGLVIGVLLTWIRRDQYPPAGPLSPEGGLWNAWKAFAQRMGNYQSRVWMAFLYFSLVLPFGLAVALLADPFKAKQARGTSNWQPKKLPSEPTIDEARRQF